MSPRWRVKFLHTCSFNLSLSSPNILSFPHCQRIEWPSVWCNFNLHSHNIAWLFTYFYNSKSLLAANKDLCLFSTVNFTRSVPNRAHYVQFNGNITLFLLNPLMYFLPNNLHLCVHAHTHTLRTSQLHMSQEYAESQQWMCWHFIRLSCSLTA